jgi:predicted DNA-binding protein with PD1-like motif
MPRVTVIPGAEVIDTITKAVAEAGITDASITLIGAVDEATISTMPRHDALTDNLTTYTEPLELTGTGEVVDGAPHIHVVLCREGDKTVGGHLHAATVRTFFVHAYVTPSD